MKELERRRVATQATLDAFRGEGFDWKRNCVHLFAEHAANMGREIPEVPPIATVFDARAALKERGWVTVEDMLDDLLGERIAPARMILGDIGVLDGDVPGLDAIVICAGPLKFFGWAEATGALEVIDVSLDKFKGAWRA